MRHEFVAEREQCVLLVVDVQSAMLKVISGWETIADKVNRLVQAANALGVPVAVTEHYRKGLGATIPEVSNGLGDARIFQKEYFSACLEPDFLPAMSSFGRNRVVVAGMETHVCVLQTGLNLLKAGYQLHVVEDAVGSRSASDRVTAINLFREAGAVITCTEAVIFQWACRSNTDEFRKILPIVK